MKTNVTLIVLFLAFVGRLSAQTNPPVLQTAGATAGETNSHPRIAFEVTKGKAAKGEAAAQNSLGVMYATGSGVEQNRFEASRWFRKTAEQGDKWGQYYLALYWLWG